MAFLSTSASMIAFINSIVAGVGVAVLAGNRLGRPPMAFTVLLGLTVACGLVAAFVIYERWRFRVFERAERSEQPKTTNDRHP